MATAKKENGYMSGAAKIDYPFFSNQIIAIAGGFGSGKTEISVNLARFLAAGQNNSVAIVDLDLVNPYFRSREAEIELRKLGIRAIAPRGEQSSADLPILLPEVKGAIENPDDFIILDVGGDSQGSIALGSLMVAERAKGYDMLFVVNSRRPASSDVATSLKTMARIEAASRMKFTGLISNSHLIEETNMEVIQEGRTLSDDISAETGLPVRFTCIKEDILDLMDFSGLKCPILPLYRMMLKPWERKAK